MLYLNTYFAVVYFFLNLALFVYKSYKYPFPDNGTFEWEVCFVFFYAFFEYIRIFLGQKGNKMEQLQPLVWFLGLSVGTVLLNVYYLQLQTYVLQVDYIVNIMSLTFVCSEIFFAMLAGFNFARNDRL
jgi:transmembrane protein 216